MSIYYAMLQTENNISIIHIAIRQYIILRPCDCVAELWIIHTNLKPDPESQCRKLIALPPFLLSLSLLYLFIDPNGPAYGTTSVASTVDG